VLSNRAPLGGLFAHRETQNPQLTLMTRKGGAKFRHPQSLSADFTQIALMQIAETPRRWILEQNVQMFIPNASFFD
jgi:hypothetical protein